MQTYKQEFLQLALKHGALKFGEFTLKSGRISPYFFNLGAIASGAGMARLARCYAQALIDSDLQYDGLFGPAYKGIPLVSATACMLADQGQDTVFAYNRKEAKDHGEGGNLVGAPLAGNVVIIDDVITAGTAVRQAIDLINTAGANVCGLLVALDRQERANGDQSAIAALHIEFGLRTVAICTLADVIEYLEIHGGYPGALTEIATYRQRYGT